MDHANNRQTAVAEVATVDVEPNAISTLTGLGCNSQTDTSNTAEVGCGFRDNRSATIDKRQQLTAFVDGIGRCAQSEVSPVVRREEAARQNNRSVFKHAIGLTDRIIRGQRRVIDPVDSNRNGRRIVALQSLINGVVHEEVSAIEVEVWRVDKRTIGIQHQRTVVDIVERIDGRRVWILVEHKDGFDDRRNSQRIIVRIGIVARTVKETVAAVV